MNLFLSQVRLCLTESYRVPGFRKSPCHFVRQSLTYVSPSRFKNRFT